MAYEYDVFFSYKHSKLTLGWHIRVRELLEYWLTQELNGVKARIFMDVEAIETGDRWAERLSYGLKHSKCLVPVWSPEYFQSKYCWSEWQAFARRESLAGNGTKLIAPIRFHDGQYFPAETQAWQMMDFREFVLFSPAFWDSRGALELESRIRDHLAGDIARIIQQVPEFDSTWPCELLSDLPTTPQIGLAKL